MFITRIILLSLLIFPYATPLTFNLTDIGPQNQNRDIVIEGDGAYISSQGFQVPPDDNESDPRQKAGRATYITPLHLWDNASGRLADFDTNFSFVIDARGSASHGDGLTFFLAQNNSLIVPASAMGLPTNSDQPSSRFVAVEFDTYYNDVWDPLPQRNVSVREHVGIDINSLISVKSIPWENLSNGRPYEAQINYDSVSKNLSVTVTSRENNSIIRQSRFYDIVDLRNELPEWVIFGFTAGTGGYFQTHSVKSWSFNSSDLQTASPNQGDGKSRIGMVVGLGVGCFVLVVVLAVTANVFLRGRKEEEADDGLDTEFTTGSGLKRFSYTDLSRID